MFTKKDLLSALKVAQVDPKGSLLVHSSMKSLGSIDGGADTVLDAFIEYMQEGLLIFPTHTWQDDNNPDLCFDPIKEKSCVGILGELFRQRTGVLRSLHPTHSVAVLGHDAFRYIAGEENYQTPCPRNGVWGKLYDINAQILFLGCDLTKNTFIHSVEEWFKVPERLSERFVAYKIKVDGRLINCPMRRHDAPCGDISLNYNKLLPIFLQKGAAKPVTIAQAQCYVCSARKMADISSAYLNENIDFFVTRDLL
jgi:aminoglycoside 3-N-acetyltransferase